MAKTKKIICCFASLFLNMLALQASAQNQAPLACNLYQSIQQGMTLVEIKNSFNTQASLAPNHFVTYKRYRWKFSGGGTAEAYFDDYGNSYPIILPTNKQDQPTTATATLASTAQDPQTILFNSLLAKHSLTVANAEATFGSGEFIGYHFKDLLPDKSIFSGEADSNGQLLNVSLLPGCEDPKVASSKSFQTAAQNNVVMLNLHEQPDTNSKVVAQVIPNRSGALNVSLFFKSADWGQTIDPQTQIASYLGWAKAVDLDTGIIGWVQNRDIAILPEKYRHLDNPFLPLKFPNTIDLFPRIDATKPSATLPANSPLYVVFKKMNPTNPKATQWWEVADNKGNVSWINSSITPALNIYDTPASDHPPAAQTMLSDPVPTIFFRQGDWSEVMSAVSGIIGWVKTTEMVSLGMPTEIDTNLKPVVINKAISLYQESNKDSKIVIKIDAKKSVYFFYSSVITEPGKKVAFVKLGPEDQTWWRVADTEGHYGWVFGADHDKALAP